MREAVKKFIRFLKQNNAYEAYMFNLNSRISFFKKSAFKSYVDRVGFSDFIKAAFNWERTKEGSGFWCDLHNKWIKEYLNFLIS